MIISFFELFLGGVIVGSSTCLLVCAPILLPYLIGTSGSWKKGFKATLVFSTGRLTVYIVYGFLIGLGKQIYIDYFVKSPFNTYLQVFAGLFILIIGFLLILGKKSTNLCPVLEKLLIKKNLRTVFILGLFMGMTPCPPMMAAFAYIFIKTTSLISSIFLVLSFGLGTVFSPLLVLGTFSGFISQKVPRVRALQVLKALSALVLIFWGFQIIVSRMGFFIRL